MKWVTLFTKIGKQPLKITQHQDVYAILYDKKSHQYVRKNLCLKFDTNNNPYLAEEIRNEDWSTTKPQRHKYNKKQVHR